MICFVPGENSENVEFSLSFEERRWYFTLDTTTQFGQVMYDKVKTEKLLELPMRLDIQPVCSRLNLNDVGISNVPKINDDLKVSVGDIVMSQEYVYFKLFVDYSNYIKVGEIKKSSIDDFKSFIIEKYNDGYYDENDIKLVWSIKNPNEEALIALFLYILIMIFIIVPCLLSCI